MILLLQCKLPGQSQEEKVQIIFLLGCYSLIMPLLLLQNARVAPLSSGGATPVRTDVNGEGFCALCQLFVILSLHRVFVLCNMQHYYCLFSVWYLKVVMWYQVLIRCLRSNKTPERVRAEKPASSPVLSCSLAFSGWCLCFVLWFLVCGFFF